MAAGALVLVLHSHLPYVLHHGRFPHGSEWLCEAVAECYLPLLGMFRRLVRRGILPRCTVEFSPILCEQLVQPAFRVLFQQYCREKLEAAREDELHFLRYGYGEHWVGLARFWQSWYAARLEEFLEEYRGELLPAFARLQELGVIELAGSAATHAYLPLLPDEQAVAFQLRVGAEAHRRHFRHAARSFWLPECGYYPAGDRTAVPLYGEGAVREHGLEEWLARLGVGSFVVEQQLLERAQVWGHERGAVQLSLLRPYWCVSAPTAPHGCMVLARYQSLAARIWDARTGYPGDGDYLDFHKRHYTSWLRYWRVTDNRLDMQYKLLYVPEWARQKAHQHAEHFAELIATTLAQAQQAPGGALPVACLPFDTELFGHWWFEGPLFLERLFERIAERGDVHLWTLEECRRRVDPVAPVRLPAGSWGKNAGHEPWGAHSVRWMWQVLAEAQMQLCQLLRRFPAVRRTELHERLFRQALRELLLLQASDWSFLAVTGSARDYAEQRFAFHAQDFRHLCAILDRLEDGGQLRPEEVAFVEALERRDAIFPEMVVEWWERPL